MGSDFQTPQSVVAAASIIDGCGKFGAFLPPTVVDCSSTQRGGLVLGFVYSNDASSFLLFILLFFSKPNKFTYTGDRPGGDDSKFDGIRIKARINPNASTSHPGEERICPKLLSPLVVAWAGRVFLPSTDHVLCPLRFLLSLLLLLLSSSSSFAITRSLHRIRA
jgi:hypothetical protein